MTIVCIILGIAVVGLGIALFFQVKAAHKQDEEAEQLLKDYQRRVDEQEKLLKDYRALEQNFDNVGQGYEQALLAFDKMEEEKQQMQSVVDKLQKQNQDMQQNYSQLSNSMLQKKQLIEQSATALKQIFHGFAGDNASLFRQANNILNANEIDLETAIEADDNVLVSEIIDKAVRESGISQVNYISFSTEVSEDIRQMMLFTSEAALVRGLVALLDNAAKFTTEGSVKLMIRPDGSNIRFTIEDTGMGVPTSEAEHIFEPYVKLNSYFDGAGIGLTAARSLIRRIGGDVMLDTDYNAGSRFVLSIPF
jgi:signal transduction histidine kinase